MREYVIECRNCMKHFRIEWNEEERQDIEIVCPHCRMCETKELIIVEDEEYPTLDSFRRTVYLNVSPYEQLNPLGIGGEGMSPRKGGRSRMRRIESLDLRKPEEDSLLKRARRILTRILGGE